MSGNVQLLKTITAFGAVFHGVTCAWMWVVTHMKDTDDGGVCSDRKKLLLLPTSDRCAARHVALIIV